CCHEVYNGRSPTGERPLLLWCRQRQKWYRRRGGAGGAASEKTMTSSDTPQTPKIAFDQFPWLYRVTVLLLFVAAAALRLYDLTDPPLDFHPTRQLYSALKARGMYYATLGTAADWQ